MSERVFMDRGSCCVWISMPEGRLRLSGQDLGGHPICDEYEYVITVEPDHFEAIRAALGAEPDANIIDVMCANAEAIFMKGETTWLDSLEIPYEFAN